MDQVSIAKSELRFQQWTKLVAECQSSQMTVKAWCELNNINIKTYYYWLHKIRAKALGNAPVPAVSQEPAAIEPPVKFRKLEVQTPVSGMQAAVVIRLPQASVEVSAGTDQQTVEAVLRALRCIG